MTLQALVEQLSAAIKQKPELAQASLWCRENHERGYGHEVKSMFYAPDDNRMILVITDLE